MKGRDQCPVPDCKAGRQSDHLMCKPHWFKVPKALRDEVWRLWAAEPMGRDYMAARQAAIDAASGIDRGDA